MSLLHIITPVKDSIDTTMQTIGRICEFNIGNPYYVYNDFSTSITTQKLDESTELGYQLINLSDLITTPSPNYRFILQHAQKRALKDNAALVIVESDVYIAKDTINKLSDYAAKIKDCGMVAALTTDEKGSVNFPYEHITPNGQEVIESKHHLSFCCTLLTPAMLKAVDFNELPKNKHWYDVLISKQTQKAGLKNYIVPGLRVVHIPHSSRPWKKLKYKNPFKYYIQKVFHGRDKI